MVCGRTDHAKVLARWCYQRGIGPAIAAAAPAVRLAAIRGVGDPTGMPDEVWPAVADLLQAREVWDREHGQAPPPAAACLHCAVLEQTCPGCAPRSVARVLCPACRTPLHRLLIRDGIGIHPLCEPGEDAAGGSQSGMF